MNKPAQANDIKNLFESFLGDGNAPAAPSANVADPNLADQSADKMRRVPLSSGEMMLSFAPLVEQAGPAVVNVYASRMPRERASPFADDPFFGQFFGRRMPQRQQSSLGSGVIVEASGLVVTNHHVIAGADEIKVALSDGREFESRVLLQDETLDLAVLQLDANEAFPVLALDDSDRVAVGDLVLAIGNPFGVGQTTTSGIVSALARNRVGVSDFGFFIQTDAAINPGNSGGALLGMNGKLLGINTAIFSRSGGSNGIGFAIPSNMVAAFLVQAKNGGKAFEAPWLGADFENVSAQMAESVGLNRPYGALLTAIAPDSPAEKAGLRAGDVIIGVNGSLIQHPDALGYRLITHKIGETLQLTVQRRFKAIEVPVTLIKRPDNLAGQPVLLEGTSPFSGARVALSDGKRSGINGNAIMVMAVERSSPAAQLGLREGDFVLVVNGDEIRSVEQMAEVATSDARWWRFTINRGGRIINQVLRF